jgi:hypothetical protein
VANTLGMGGDSTTVTKDTRSTTEKITGGH